MRNIEMYTPERILFEERRDDTKYVMVDVYYRSNSVSNGIFIASFRTTDEDLCKDKIKWLLSECKNVL